MDLLWLLPPAASVNGGTPTDIYLRVHKKMHHPSAQNLASLICQVCKGTWLYVCDISCLDTIPLGSHGLAINLIQGVRLLLHRCQLSLHPQVGCSILLPHWWPSISTTKAYFYSILSYIGPSRAGWNQAQSLTSLSSDDMAGAQL